MVKLAPSRTWRRSGAGNANYLKVLESEQEQTGSGSRGVKMEGRNGTEYVSQFWAVTLRSDHSQQPHWLNTPLGNYNLYNLKSQMTVLRVAIASGK